MRSDLEAAMAAVITAPSAQRQFIEDPEAFARGFSLEPPEIRSLVAMEADLTSLTASFVSKRSMSVRWSAQRTIAMLGDQGPVLVEEFIDDHPMAESFRDDAVQFSDFVVERTAAMRHDTFRSGVIAEMARFERQRSRAFWDAGSGPDAAGPRRSEDGTASDAAGKLRLTPGASIAGFEWDMRLFHKLRVVPLRTIHSDPCHLLFFHNGKRNGLRVNRLRPDEFVMLEDLSRAGSVSADLVVATPGGELAMREIAPQFLNRGAIQWV